ncbi:MAG: hypothetical protein HWD89_12455 [Tenacibaculum sp.]|uniref:hypothetical protein n=1 Tax=Tenacibaculum sp. TaxID=1906242 RepID=UPI00185D0112|nr:hypothetical protein [Tenacibaculum sp.]NVK09855.1 hypothetical protein [Tenacibaculum sp.]
MKKTAILLFLGVFLYNCKKNLRNEINDNIEKATVKKELQFCLYNSTKFQLNNITIGLPDTSLTYKLLDKYNQTKWVNIKSAYHYGFVRFFDKKNRKYYIQPIDYVGETLLEKGQLKFIIKSVDSTNKSFELDSDYKNN